MEFVLVFCAVALAMMTFTIMYDAVSSGGFFQQHVLEDLVWLFVNARLSLVCLLGMAWPNKIKYAWLWGFTRCIAVYRYADTTGARRSTTSINLLRIWTRRAADNSKAAALLYYRSCL